MRLKEGRKKCRSICCLFFFEHVDRDLVLRIASDFTLFSLQTGLKMCNIIDLLSEFFPFFFFQDFRQASSGIRIRNHLLVSQQRNF